MDHSFALERPLTNLPTSVTNWTKATAFRGVLLEFFGTAYFAYGISCSRNDPILVALSLFTPLLFFIDFSGAYFNPAITVINIIKPKNKMPLFTGIIYISVQIFGATFSGLLAYGLINNPTSPYIVSDRSWNWAIRCFFTETIGSFIFALIILIQNHEETKLTEDRIWGPFVIMISFMIGRAYTNQSGGCLNPGIALGLEIFESVRQNDSARLKNLWLYILAPIFGGIFALSFYLRVYRPLYIIKTKDNKRKSIVNIAAVENIKENEKVKNIASVNFNPKIDEDKEDDSGSEEFEIKTNKTAEKRKSKSVELITPVENLTGKKNNNNFVLTIKEW